MIILPYKIVTIFKMKHLNEIQYLFTCINIYTFSIQGEALKI